jgi:hypothetical protein
MILKSYIKNFSLLEFIVVVSLIYVLSMLIWTASTRSSVAEKANAIKENHNKVVSFLNNQINECEQNPNNLTKWKENCNEKWSANLIVDYLIKEINLKNPYSIKSNLIKAVPDPRISAEGKAGQSTDKGIIFLPSFEFLPETGSEWLIGTCVKSPCVAAGNNELVSIYR